MSDETPKPCLICGKPAEHIEADQGHYVYCSNDDCEARPCTRPHATEEQAVAAWNHDETH